MKSKAHRVKADSKRRPRPWEARNGVASQNPIDGIIYKPAFRARAVVMNVSPLGVVFACNSLSLRR